MKKLTKKIEKEIQEYVEENQPTMYWDSTSINIDVISEILEKGLARYTDEIYDYDMEYIWELEHDLIENIKEQWKGYDPKEIEEFTIDYIHVDLNISNFLSQIPDIVCQAVVYSNYDCCNSMDRFEDGGYLPEVFNRVKAGVKKDDYMDEFYNGAYGGCLFCLVFKTDIKTLLKMKTGKEIFIPKGTQFGFFSSFQGAGTPFEKRTYQDMTMPLKDGTEYDSVGITVDMQQSYNMSDVYGDTSFVDSQDVETR